MQSLFDEQKILKKEHGNTDKRMCFLLVSSIEPAHVHVCEWNFPSSRNIKWQHRKLMNVDCSHIFTKQYFCSMKFNNFLKFQRSNLNLNGFVIILQYRCL